MKKSQLKKIIKEQVKQLQLNESLIKIKCCDKCSCTAHMLGDGSFSNCCVNACGHACRYYRGADDLPR